LIIRWDDQPCFPGRERRAVVTLYRCEGLHLFEVEERNERGLETQRRLAEACVVERRSERLDFVVVTISVPFT
jgi:hypothetical protein